MIRIYLDLCCFNRPFDDQDSLAIYLETQAKLEIQEKVRNRELRLAWSTMLDYENSANSDRAVMQEIEVWRNIADDFVHQYLDIVTKAQELADIGFSNTDSLHIACAAAANCDYFITVDKGILKKKSSMQNIKIINPIEFISYLEEIK